MCCRQSSQSTQSQSSDRKSKGGIKKSRFYGIFKKHKHPAMCCSVRAHSGYNDLASVFCCYTLHPVGSRMPSMFLHYLAIIIIIIIGAQKDAHVFLLRHFDQLACSTSSYELKALLANISWGCCTP